MADGTWKKKEPVKYLLITIGVVLLAASVKWIYEPKNMVTGGLTGLAIVIKEWSGGFIKGGVPLWLTNAVCNIPLFYVALKMKGKGFVIKTLYATGLYILLLYFIPEMDAIGQDYLMAAVYGGAMNGLGLGLVFMNAASTGGTDLLSTILHGWMKSIRIPKILLTIDVTIVCLGTLAFGLRNALYAVIAVYLTSKVMDGVLEGLKFAKLVLVISERYDVIAGKVMGEMRRGVTSIAVKGMYRNSDRKMLLCVVSKREVVKVMELASSIDAAAFMIVSDVREVMGEGFVRMF